jgi:hypothetical protein
MYICKYVRISINQFLLVDLHLHKTVPTQLQVYVRICLYVVHGVNELMGCNLKIHGCAAWPTYVRTSGYIYRVFSAQTDWTLTHTSLKDTEQSTIEPSIILDGVTLTGPLIR